MKTGTKIIIIIALVLLSLSASRYFYTMNSSNLNDLRQKKAKLELVKEKKVNELNNAKKEYEKLDTDKYKEIKSRENLNMIKYDEFQIILN